MTRGGSFFNYFMHLLNQQKNGKENDKVGIQFLFDLYSIRNYVASMIVLSKQVYFSTNLCCCYYYYYCCCCYYCDCIECCYYCY